MERGGGFGCEMDETLLEWPWPWVLEVRGGIALGEARGLGAEEEEEAAALGGEVGIVVEKKKKRRAKRKKTREAAVISDAGRCSQL